MKRFALTMVLLAALCLGGPAADLSCAKAIKLSYANFPPAPTFPCVQMERWKTEVEKRTGGQVVVDTYPGGMLLGAKGMVDGVIAGQADIGCVSTAYFPGRFVFTDVASLPLGIPDARTGSLVLWDLYQKYSPEEFGQVKVLTMFSSAPSNIMSRKRVASLDDIQNLNLRASGGALQIVKAWGANGVGMPMSATPEALQKGVVEGLFSSLDVLKDFKFAELCKYVTLTDTVIYPFAVMMNMDSWNALPPDVQKVLDELAPEQAEWTGSYLDGHVQESAQWSKDNQQVEFIQLSEAEKAAWNDRLKPLIDDWTTQAEAKGLDAGAILEDVRALTKKHSGR
ncbi:MAG: TRAP transporter substrate-binding protein [Desulfobacterales bacterium]|jgi:TRAP-type C4-dicarboxylate transport system substrate-binding protein